MWKQINYKTNITSEQNIVHLVVEIMIQYGNKNLKKLV